ncbi:MAG: hypothetical protein MI755_16390 [Sphingomonadales bacterium]|nr:hypothetical protein [Sphingomonadales bacterium]
MAKDPMSPDEIRAAIERAWPDEPHFTARVQACADYFQIDVRNVWRWLKGERQTHGPSVPLQPRHFPRPRKR